MKWFNIIQIIAALLLIGAILLQNRGADMSGLLVVAVIFIGQKEELKKLYL